MSAVWFSGFEEVAAVPVGVKLHTVNYFQLYVSLERLVENIPFEVLNQLRDSVGIGPCFATVVAGSESVGIVSLTNKGAVGFNEFLYSRPETAGKRGKDGFVDDHFWAGLSELPLIATK